MGATTYGPGGGNGRVMPEEVDANDAAGRDNRTTDVGEETTRQDYVDLLGGTLRFGSGNPANPCGIPGYGDLYTGTYSNYRLIRRHPTVAHVRRQVFAPVTYNAFGWGATSDAPAGAKDLMQRMFTPKKIRYIKSHGCLALDYGCMGGENVWEFREGTFWFERFKPLVIDTMGVMVDRGTGRFAGLRWGAGDAWLKRSKFKCSLFTYGQAQGGEAGFLYGESRLENIRETSWFDWINAAQQLMWITQKLAGKLCIITSPGGTYVVGKDDEGKDITRSYRDAAMSAGKAIADPRSNGVVWMPTAALPGNITAANMELMKYPMVQVQVVDFGSHSDAIEGTLSRMKYHDGRMSAGYLRSARTNQESEHGSRADSVEQTNTDTIDLEGVDSDLWDTINEQMVDAALVLKYGPDARGTVFGIPAKMTDENRTFDDKVIDAALLDDELRVDILTGDEGKGVEAIMRRRGWPGEKPIKLEPYDPGDTGGDGSPNDKLGPNAPKKPDPTDEGDGITKGDRKFGRATLSLSRDPAPTGGKWVTIRGVHVYIKDGKIVDGPKTMVGKTPDEVGKIEADHGDKKPADGDAGGKHADHVESLRNPDTVEKIDDGLPKVKPGDKVDGRTVGAKVPNMASIDAELSDPHELSGIREVPIALFSLTGKHYNAAEQKKTDALAEAIKQSGTIAPLIVVFDGHKDGPYILEGSHRIDALYNSGAKSFPAKVVVDLDAYPDFEA